MQLMLAGPVGSLEAELWLPVEAGAIVPRPPVACAFCHPHPLYGGSMRSSVVFRASRGLQRAGAAVLRFNFRGVGKSEGEHDGQGGEEQDLSAALDELQRRFPKAELWAAGFSFGARTAAGLALREPRIARLILVGLPVLRFDCSALARLTVPGLLVQAGEDEFGRPEDVRRLTPEVAERFRLEEIPGTDHYFRDSTKELEERVARYAGRVLHPEA